MKRGLAVIVIALSLIFIIALSPVNAGWDDFWGKITGKAAAEECTGIATSCGDIDSLSNEKAICIAQEGCEWVDDQEECNDVSAAGVKACSEFIDDETGCGSQHGCTWTPTFQAAFTVSPTEGIESLTVNLASTSIGDITNYHWAFGEGEGTAEGSGFATRTHNYTSPDTYTINLTITEAITGATDSTTREVVVTDCGDGVIEGLEECDDGNSDNDDGCSSMCAVEEGWDCEPDTIGKSVCISLVGDCIDKVVGGLPTDFCQTNYGETQISGTCKTTFPSHICTPFATTCDTFGDCENLSNEECEADSFAEYCKRETPCGNRELETDYNEQCDDGNTEDGDGCSSICQKESGITQTEESPETTMCTSGDKGLKCEETAAENYCKGLEYDGYAENSKICDGGEGHDATGNWANSDVDYRLGICNDLGSDKWITELICYTVAVVADVCVDSDINTENPYYVAGDVKIDGIVEGSDSCGADEITLTEWYCDIDGEIASKQITCTTNCQANACVVPAGGLYCLADDPVAGLAKAQPKSRDESNAGNLYYCDLDLSWKPALADDADCTAHYECIDNSCVEGKCFAVKTALKEQAGILNKILCIVTNIGSFIRGDITGYCDCLSDKELTDEDRCI